jgi:fructose-1,6-bisphosphatase/inositol monophosphatase family enzyme
MSRNAIRAYNEAIEKETRQKIQELLSANKMSYHFTVDSQGYIKITVENGDWKHDHIALKHIMREAGYISFGRHILDEEENGDDSFSAIYLYR